MFKPITEDAIRLIHDGAVALSQAEYNGFKIDTDYLDRAIDGCQEKIRQIESWIKDHPKWEEWKRTFGSKAKIGSDEQIGQLINEKWGLLEKGERTESGKWKTDTDQLAEIDDPFVRAWGKRKWYGKMVGTFLGGIKRETDPEGFLHTCYNLNIAATYRSSSELINMQNLPIRHPVGAKIIRRAIIPRKKTWRLVEADFSGIEVKVAACYHKDPVMIEYIKDPTKDMHRDMAAEIFRINQEKVTKAMRHCSKNQFVFPQFYGDFYWNNARAIWKSVKLLDLHLDNGMHVYDWLAKKGITELGTQDAEHGSFTHHLKEVEHGFWKERFKVYDRWKDKWYSAYLKNGGFSMFTGFQCRGSYSKKIVINYPIQGAAFHCLLWSVIQVTKWLNDNNMKSKLIGQIHDSMILDVHPDEFDAVVAYVRHIMSVKIRKHFKWLIVPIDIEIEATEPGESWYTKKPI